MPIFLGYRLGWRRFGGRARIDPTIHLAVNAGLHVGAVIGNPVETDSALVADHDLLDTYGAAGIGSRKSKNDERAGG